MKPYLLLLLLAACSSAPPPLVEARLPQNFRLAADAPLDLDALPLAPGAEAIRAADARLARRDPAAADLLATVATPAAELLRARLLAEQGESAKAAEALAAAAADGELAELVALERALLATEPAAAAPLFLPLLEARGAVASRAASRLVDILPRTAPDTFLERFADLDEQLPAGDLDAQSRLLEGRAVALEVLGRTDEARAARLVRYLEAPVSPLTPDSPPNGAEPTAAQLLARAEKLQEAHRSERVLTALAALPEKSLTPAEACRRRFALGMAHRKLHNYAQAEIELGEVAARCKDEELVRRALYLRAKVVSIQDGLRAVPLIDSFAERYGTHSMVDDTLFWAGDIYQRRARFDEAARYYRRIDGSADKGDHCADARWRLGWMAYRKGELEQARRELERTFLADGCAPERYDRARARYWLGRIQMQRGERAAGLEHYREVLAIAPLSFYAQMATKWLLEAPETRDSPEVVARLRPPASAPAPALCPAALADNPDFVRGIELLRRGLVTDARAHLVSIKGLQKQVVATAHAESQGIAPERATRQGPVEGACSGAQSGLLLALALDRAGAHHEAHWRLRTELGELLERFPTPREMSWFKAAYPLAYRDVIEAAEKESGLPPLFLQSLSREESAFDPEVVSWAGAYGLTQLLLSAGQAAGRLLEPPVQLSRAEELMDPALNARLGGALLASFLRRYKHPALSLVAYNANESFASALWQRHANDAIDHFAEEIGIRETRGYVARVLRTYGIYRWLYAEAPVALPVPFELPGP